jgi:hypothetical protein
MLPAFILVACGGGDGVRRVTALDSAGIRIMTLGSGYIDSIPAWLVSDTPSRSIGVTLGDQRFEFSQIIDVAPHPAGILVADGGSNLIRVFDNDGNHLRDLGGTGEGPGEYRRLSWLQVLHDSLYTWDSTLNRLTVWSPDLTVARSEPARLATTRPTVVLGMFNDGDLLVSVIGPAEEAPLGQVRDGGSVNFSRSGGTFGDTIITIGEVAGRPVYVSEDRIVQPVPFTILPSFALSGVGLYVGNGAAHEFRRYPSEQGPDLIVRFPPGSPLTPADRDQYRADFLATYTGDRRDTQARVFDLVPQPATPPSFDRLVASTADMLWVRRFSMPRDTRQMWLVLSQSGEPRGRVSLPLGVEPLTITPTQIFARSRDSLGIQTVVVYTYEAGS